MSSPAEVVPSSSGLQFTPVEGGIRVLILGGCGFIGRNLVAYLCDNLKEFNINKIIVADKSMPITSNLNNKHKAYFDCKNVVEFKQADLSKDPHVERIFKDGNYKYVINLCGETRFGMTEAHYKTMCVETAKKCATAAAALGTVDKFIEVSTAQVYASDKSPSNEDAKLKPWSLQATCRLQAEEEIKKVTGLKWVVLRPAIVYGEADLTGLTPRISCAAVYQQRKEKMKFLWDKDLRINVVHVTDVVHAIWKSCTDAKEGSIFNLADESDLTQGGLNEMLSSLFGIETGFLGSLISNLARLNLSAVAEEGNDKHVPGWTELCNSHKILNTPISPYIDAELLKNNHLSIDGRRIATQLTGFKYSTPKISRDILKQQIDSFIQQGVFPPVLQN